MVRAVANVNARLKFVTFRDAPTAETRFHRFQVPIPKPKFHGLRPSRRRRVNPTRMLPTEAARGTLGPQFTA